MPDPTQAPEPDIGGAVGGGGGGGGAAVMVPSAVTICDRVISSARSSISQRSWSSGR